MTAGLRTVSRTVEFFHLPTKSSVEQLRAIYVAVSEFCEYDNFIRTADGARLDTTRADVRMSLTFQADRMTFREEGSPGSFERFAKRIEHAIGVVVKTLHMPMFVARNITLRAHLAVPGGSRDFLSEHVFSLDPEHFAPFGRAGTVAGFRVQFPPQNPATEALHRIRIENAVSDPNALFIEDVATYQAPAPSQDWSRFANEVRSVESFLEERVVKFVEQFLSS